MACPLGEKPAGLAPIGVFAGEETDIPKRPFLLQKLHYLPGRWYPSRPAPTRAEDEQQRCQQVTNRLSLQPVHASQHTGWGDDRHVQGMGDPCGIGA